MGPACPPGASTIDLPIGNTEIQASFKWAHAKGNPIMVTAHAKADDICPRANHQPARTNHSTLPKNPKTPVPTSSFPDRSRRSTAMRPNGHREYRAILKDERTHGIPTTVRAIKHAAKTHPKNIIKPPRSTQITFSTRIKGSNARPLSITPQSTRKPRAHHDRTDSYSNKNRYRACLRQRSRHSPYTFLTNYPHPIRHPAVSGYWTHQQPDGKNAAPELYVDNKFSTRALFPA